jgi:Lytic transglycolase
MTRGYDLGEEYPRLSTRVRAAVAAIGVRYVPVPNGGAASRTLACLGLALLLLVSACATIRIPSIGPRERAEVGEASWYGRRHHGLRTATGERYDQYAMTAAHPDLPFGSRVRVRSLKNGKSVVVRINDRGRSCAAGSSTCPTQPRACSA